MSTTLNSTLERKQQNQNFILNNLDKFILDGRGNFFNTEDDNYIGKEIVSNYEEIKKKMIEMIIQNKENWETIEGLGYLGSFKKNYREKSSGRVMFSDAFSWEENFRIKCVLENSSQNSNSLSETDESNETVLQQETLTEFNRQSNERERQNQENFSSIQRREIDQTIIESMSSKPFISDFDLDSNLWSGYKNWIDKTWGIEINDLENFKNQVLLAIEEARTKKRSNLKKWKKVQTINNKSNKFENWKEKKIERMKNYVPKREIKGDKTGISETPNSSKTNTKNNNFPTGWLVGGISLLTVGGLITLLMIKSKKKKIIISLVGVWKRTP